MVNKHQSEQFSIGEHIDCLDSVNKWCNAEIVAKRGPMLKVHFTGWSYKYDEWISEDSERVLKQWRRGMPLKVGHRLDVRDVKGKWLEAVVVQVNDHEQVMKVHFKGWASKWDELLPFNEEQMNNLLDLKFAEIGRYSDAYGAAKFEKNNHP